MSQKSSFEIVNVDQNLNNQLIKNFLGEDKCFVQVGPKKFFFPEKFRKISNDIYNFEARPSDIWLVTYPRSGTTWAQELIWIIANNLDYESAKFIEQAERFPFFELFVLANDKIVKDLVEENKDNKKYQEIVLNISSSPFEQLNNIKGPRFIKTHLPISLLPPSVLKSGCKIIYVARHPKDVCVSFYYMNKSSRFLQFQGDFENFWNFFINDLVVWSPYWEHVKEGWERRNNANVLFMFYEDMKKDLSKSAQNVANFLEKTLTNDETQQLVKFLHFDNFAKIPTFNQKILYDVNIFSKTGQKFIRSGKSHLSTWPQEFTPKIIEQFQQWMRINLVGTDLRFPEL